MSIKTITIRFNEEEQKLLDLYMDSQTQSLSTVLKEVLFEDIANFFDDVDSEKAIEFNSRNSKRYTTHEIIEELDLNQN